MKGIPSRRAKASAKADSSRPMIGTTRHPALCSKTESLGIFRQALTPFMTWQTAPACSFRNVRDVIKAI